MKMKNKELEVNKKLFRSYNYYFSHLEKTDLVGCG